MLRLLCFLQAGFLMAASAQPTDARDILIYPTNPPKPASPQTSAIPRQAKPFRSPLVPANPVFSILKSALDETDPAAKELKVSILYLSSEKPEPSAVKVTCNFYEADGTGNFQLTESKITPNWTSSPIDWSGDQTEELTLRYTAPPADSGKKYAGYLIAIYYKDQLQDGKSNSRELLQKFPLEAAMGVAGSSSGSTDASDRFLEAYKSFQAAENSFAEGSLIKAKEACKNLSPP